MCTCTCTCTSTAGEVGRASLILTAPHQHLVDATVPNPARVKGAAGLCAFCAHNPALVTMNARACGIWCGERPQFRTIPLLCGIGGGNQDCTICCSSRTRTRARARAH